MKKRKRACSEPTYETEAVSDVLKRSRNELFPCTLKTHSPETKADLQYAPEQFPKRATKRLGKKLASLNKNSKDARIWQWFDSIPKEPQEALQEADMSDSSSQKRGRSPSDTTEQSGSTWNTRHRTNVINRFWDHGIMVRETSNLHEEHEVEYNTYLDGNLVPGICLPYPQANLPTVIREVGLKTEAFVRRDIMPWTVPSAFNLHLTQECEMDLSKFEESMDTVWNDCNTMGSLRPKPDYVVGLPEAAFTLDELKEIQKQHTRQTPMRVHAGMLLPYLVCEAKNGTAGMLAAEFQNTHSGGILVHAMFKLYRKAFQRSQPETLSNLCGQMIVWTIDLNHERVNIYGHYGTLDDIADPSLSGLRIYRHRVKEISLHNTSDRFIPYNFARNIYEKFMPIHLKRIRDALSQIKQNEEVTGLSFGASEVSRVPVSAEDTCITTWDTSPNELVGVTLMKQQLSMLMDQMRAQTQQLEQQKAESKVQLEQQKAEFEEQKAQLHQIIDLIKERNT